MANRAIADINTIQWTNLERVLNEFADYFIQQARSNLGKNGSYASGALGDTMQKIIEIKENHYSVSIELQNYWEHIENGRKPGKFPPPYRIQEWISVKPVHPRPLKNGKLPTVKQLSFLIGRKIAEEGIQPKPFFKPALQDALARFQDSISYAIDEDVAVWVQDLVLRQGIYEDLFNVL